MPNFSGEIFNGIHNSFSICYNGFHDRNPDHFNALTLMNQSDAFVAILMEFLGDLLIFPCLYIRSVHANRSVK